MKETLVKIRAERNGGSVNNGLSTDLKLELEAQLYNARIMPNGPAYRILLEHGVLKTDSNESAKRSFRSYTDRMSGYETINFTPIISQHHIEWPDFAAHCITPLVRGGLIFDVGPKLNLPEGQSFYVVQEGKRNVAEKRLKELAADLVS